MDIDGQAGFSANEINRSSIHCDHRHADCARIIKTSRANLITSKNEESSDDLNLKKIRPVAGEKRKFATGEALFFCPFPIPTGNVPMDLGGSFVEVNDTFLDLGSSNFGKAFQARAMIGLGMMFIFSCLIILPLLAGSTTWGSPFSESFWDITAGMFDFGVTFSIWGGGIAALLGIYVILSTTRAKSRTRPIRFNRQRREACFFPEGSDLPVIQPWEEIASWLSISTGVAGVGVTSAYTFGMAFNDSRADAVHFVRQGVMTPAHALGKWEPSGRYNAANRSRRKCHALQL